MTTAPPIKTSQPPIEHREPVLTGTRATRPARHKGAKGAAK
jgi:hypothetical protein